MGWIANLPDSLSYASWMEQARNGHALFQVLYTTSPHAHIYFNPILWSAGTLSRLFGGAPTGWLNLAGFIAALACPALVHAIVLRLDLGRRAAFWSAAVTVFGSGWSWISLVLAKVVGGEAFRGADLRFMDLLPSSAMITYPFHTIGFALVALLWWLALRLEQASLQPKTPLNKSTSVCWWLILVGVAALLAASRPYEPAAFLGIYTIYCLSAMFRQSIRLLGFARLRIWLALALGVFPGLVYSVWLSAQPVWKDFAARSLHIARPREFWVIGFGGLWLLAALGLPRLMRGKNSPRYFPAFWCLFLAVWLPVFDSPYSKLAAGGGLALALTAGVAVARADGWLEKIRGLNRVVATGLFIGLLSGPLSLLAIVREATIFPPKVDAAVHTLAQQLRSPVGGVIPTVLCESDVGAALPGLAGLRVVCGHWSLTDHYDERRQWLAQAGLEPDTPSSQTPEQQLTFLRSLASREGCDYLFISSLRPVASLVAHDPIFEPFASRNLWKVYRILRQSPTALARNRLATTRPPATLHPQLANPL